MVLPGGSGFWCSFSGVSGGFGLDSFSVPLFHVGWAQDGYSQSISHCFWDPTAELLMNPKRIPNVSFCLTKLLSSWLYVVPRDWVSYMLWLQARNVCFGRLTTEECLSGRILHFYLKCSNSNPGGWHKYISHQSSPPTGRGRTALCPVRALKD